MKSEIAIAGIFVHGSFALLSLLFGSIAAGTPPEAELAIKGYDTVAYFKAGKALKGNESFTFRWHNMTWHFSNPFKAILCVQGPAMVHTGLHSQWYPDIAVIGCRKGLQCIATKGFSSCPVRMLTGGYATAR